MSNSFYRAFEERYRGPRELIKERLRVYLPFIEPLKEIDSDCKAVDLGCGRGEWLELLIEHGFDVTGIDLDDSMLAACRELGLPAEHGDAITHLRGLPDASVGVVSGFHVAEHIVFSDLQSLVQEALRVLAPAGLLILETPNSENLSVGASKFYYDPTHQRPIPPHLLSFLPAYYGFERTKVLRLQEPAELAQATDVGLANVLLDVSPDYAVVAQKAGHSQEQLGPFEAAFAKEYGVDLDHLARRYDDCLGYKLAEILSRVDRTTELDARARAAEQALAAIYSSISWRVTAPLRAIAAPIVKIRNPTATSKLTPKQSLKRHLVRTAAYLNSHQKLKSMALRALRPFPRVLDRLARAAIPPPEDLVGDGQALPPNIGHITAETRSADSDLVPKSRKLMEAAESSVAALDDADINVDFIG